MQFHFGTLEEALCEYAVTNAITQRAKTKGDSINESSIFQSINQLGQKYFILISKIVARITDGIVTQIHKAHSMVN